MYMYMGDDTMSTMSRFYMWPLITDIISNNKVIEVKEISAVAK